VASVRAAERHLKIREALSAADFVDSATLRAWLKASEATIRRDLERLEAEGALRRVHGGAVSVQPHDKLLDFAWLHTRFAEEKARIGRAAAALFEDGQTVILDGGSTVAEVARHVASRRLQVITNSLPIAHVLSESRTCDLTLTGGHLLPRLGVMLGPLCERMLRSIGADLLVMGSGGVTGAGLSNSNPLVVGSERAMIDAARRVVVVADPSKFGRQAMVKVASLEEVDVVVSTDGLAPEHRELLARAGVELILA
jgi:DeoR/GlpR family transcriptional regulator of sugar metabolism